MARLMLYTGLVVGYAGIAITALPHRKRGNKYERLLDRNKTTDKNLWRSDSVSYTHLDVYKRQRNISG